MIDLTMQRALLFLGGCGLVIVAACSRPVEGQYYTELESTSPSVETAVPPTTETSTVVPTKPVTPSPAYPGTYSGTPTPNATPLGYSERTANETHTVQSGQTLSWIAAIYGCTIDEIVAANGLGNADSLSVGQALVIPVAPSEMGPDFKLVPDSEVVYGPAYIHFDLDGFIQGQGGYLASYSEQVGGQVLSGADVVQTVSERLSVGPRVLLALLEMQSGWVTQPSLPESALQYPLGHNNANAGLFYQLDWAARQINDAYYGWKLNERTSMRLANGTRVAVAPGLNAGTAAVQNCLAGVAGSYEQWLAMVGPDGFVLAYQRLFGNSFAFSVEPLVPTGLEQPAMQLPWVEGLTWYLVSGPHGGWDTGSGRAAIDFVSGERMLGCAPSREWVTAAAPGLVTRSEDGHVILDLDGDGFEQSGWVVFYLHIYGEGRVAAGTWLEPGDPIGRPSCEGAGGFAEASHVHIARRYNGEWIPAGTGSVPMVLSGWTVHDGDVPYDGTMMRGDEVRTACECWDDDINGFLLGE